MKPMNIRKSKTERIFEILDKNGYISDSQSAKILGHEKLYNIGEYERIWKRLKTDRDFFSDKKIIEKQKGHRCHMVRCEGMKDGAWYKVGKEYFKEIDL